MRLAEEIHILSKYNSDGELILRNHENVWNFHISRGQLLYTTGGFHPVRRWDRALKQHRPNWNWNAEYFQSLDNQPWECQLLDRGLSQKQLGLIQAKLVIRSVVQECLFDLSKHTDIKSDWQPGQKAISTLSRIIALSANEMQIVLNAATQMQEQWQAAGLAHLSPTLAPVLQLGANPKAVPISDKYLNGKFTLWDIALQLGQSVIEVTCSLLPFVEKNILQFHKIPDLPLPTAKQPVAPTLPLPETPSPLSETPPTKPAYKLPQKQPLIACIDDSPVLAHTLKKILTPAGYQMLSIPEPMRGFTQLIEHKPDLILLDLHLPNADGYSICKFLRNTPVFKKIPIIILTAKNSQVDRASAKLAGATEFLTKPPKPQELLQMLQKYLT